MAKILQRLLEKPKMNKLLAELKQHHPVYQAARPAEPILPETATVKWPANVEYTDECINEEGITFEDVGKLGSCQ